MFTNSRDLGLEPSGRFRSDIGDSDAECESYAKSLESYLKYIETNPNANIALPPGFSNYKEYIKVQQERADCI